jgi:4-amino-4-deoxy-L-arabinose transferase-like glycosyltransferase
MKKFFVVLFFFLLAFFAYLFFSPGKTAYNHFTLLADAFIKGKLYITADAPWLEKIPINSMDFYVANPPMPAIISIPFVLIFGKDFPQNYIAAIVGGLIVSLIVILSLRIKNDYKLAIWSGLLAGFGNIIWFMSSVGSVWYFGQLVACMFLFAAIVESFGKKRIGLVGILVGAAFLSRINTIVCIPIFIYLLKDKLKNLKNIFLLISSVGIFILINALYNFARFGVFWDKGYLLIPGVSTEPWYKYGVENPIYIPNNLKVAFISLPKRIPNFPFFKPTWGGMAIELTTPAFIFSLFASIKDKLIRFTWLAILLISLTVFMHGETGYAQFGYRFAVDFYPFLFLLTIKGVSKGNLKWYHWLLLIVSIGVNAWGVILINKLHIVGS